MCNEKQSWSSAAHSLHRSTVVERRDHCLSGTGRRDQQIAIPIVLTFKRELIEHLLLIALRRDIEKCERRCRRRTRLQLERCAQRGHARRIERIVRLELVVFPQRVEVCFRAGVQRFLAALGEFHCPFEAAEQRRRRKIRAPDIRRSKSTAPMKDPCFCMKPGAPSVERHLHRAASEPCQRIDRVQVGRAHVGGCQHTNGTTPDARGARCGCRLQHINQLSNT